MNTGICEGKYLDGNVFLSWTRGDYVNFKVYKSSNKITFTNIGTSTSSKYIDVNVQQTTIYYKVCGVNNGVETQIGEIIMIKPTLLRDKNCIIKFSGTDGNAGLTVEDGEHNRIRTSIIPSNNTMHFEKIISSAITTYTQTIKDSNNNLSFEVIIPYGFNVTQFYNGKIILNYLYNSYNKNIVKVAKCIIRCNILNNQINVLEKTITNNFPFAFVILDPVMTNENKIKVTLNVTESKTSANGLAINDEIKVISDTEIILIKS